MSPPRPLRAPRGMTLLELMFVVAISGIIVAAITKTLIDLDRTSRVRNLNIQMQGEGRDALQVVERDLRKGSLGATQGVIYTQDAPGSVVRRPGVQIFDNVTGGGGLDVKPGTDAFLVVGAAPLGGRAAAQGPAYDSTASLAVTQTNGFQVGDPVLAGSYQQAAWARITDIVPAAPGTPGSLGLDATQNVYPGGKLAAGSMVWAGRARLYYVDALDELVQLELAVPRAPASGDEILERQVIARGFENLQIDCDVDGGGGCPAPDGTVPAAAEATWAFGNWGAGAGVRFDVTPPNVTLSGLRSVALMVVLRSRSSLAGQSGDATIALGNQAALQPGLPPGGDPTQPYLRRAYRLSVAVRNVSLGAL